MPRPMASRPANFWGSQMSRGSTAAGDPHEDYYNSIPDIRAEMHRTIRSSIEWIDVLIHRQSPNSAYIPMRAEGQ